MEEQNSVHHVQQNEGRRGIRSLQSKCSSLAMNDTKKLSLTTSWFNCNTSLMQQQPIKSRFMGNSKQSRSDVDSADDNNEQSPPKKYIQNEQSKMVNQDIMAITAEQRPSVIRFARKNNSFGTFGTEPFLQSRDARCHEKSCSRKHEDDEAPLSFRTFTHTEPAVTTKTNTSRPNSMNKECKYKCRFCGKIFQWNSHWQAHERIHTGEKPFKCDECGKAFTRSDGLQCHKVIHLKNRSFQSPQEKAKHVEENRAYEQHVGDAVDEDVFGPEIIRDNKRNLFKCRFCNRIIITFTGFLRHVQRHQDKCVFKCDTCDKVFSKQSALEIHNRIHTGLRPYHCNTCTKAFTIYGNLRRHLIIHTEERPYTCSKCHRSFNNPSHLTRHIKNKHVVSYSSG